MNQSAKTKLIEYNKLIDKLGYVIELGSLDTSGGNRHLLKDYDDFIGIDCKRGPGVDMVADCTEVDRLFDFCPDTIICLDVFKYTNSKRKIIKAIRETLSGGGYLMVFIPHTGEGSCVDALFEGYKVLDLSIVESTICGIALKPYRI